MAGPAEEVAKTERDARTVANAQQVFLASVGDLCISNRLSLRKCCLRNAA